MHVLFVHQSFPAQFGHIGSHLVKQHGWRVTFVSRDAGGRVGGIDKVRYRPAGGATSRTHYLARSFENAVAHAAGVYRCLRPLATSLRPDLIVGHSGFGSTLFLPELFPEAPLINYFEHYYHPHDSELDFRPEWPAGEAEMLRCRARNATILLDLENCSAGYTPTRFQHRLFPTTYRSKLKVLHDGVPTDFWRPVETTDRRLGEERFDPATRIVTYVSRGLESMRGFDVFLRVVRRIQQRLPEVVVLVVGEDRICYGGDLRHIEGDSFKDWALAQDEYDLERIRFLGRVPPAQLAQVFNLSDLHIYLTVPFVLSWSLLDAMACGCTVLGSATAPVQEVVEDGKNGLLRDFFDVEELAEAAVQVLREPARFRHLGKSARRTIVERYSEAKVLPQMKSFFEEVAAGPALPAR